MASQFALAYRSNPFLYPSMWIGTDLEQHMNKSTAFLPNVNLTSETNDIQNVSAEHEEAISEYDPT